jgi:hypothetical protein
LVRRYRGREGKIVNELAVAVGSGATADRALSATRDGHVPAEAVVDRATGHTRPPGSSADQRDAERVMLDLLGAQLGVALEPGTITVLLALKWTAQMLIEPCSSNAGPTRAARRRLSAIRSCRMRSS